jgi:tripartite-type tricarboxylate transporter receptor subunit TctC
MTRMVAAALSERLRQTVVVENRPGAGGTIGIMALKNATPDGYTIGVLVSGNVVQPLLVKDTPFDVRKDFTMLTSLYVSPLVMIVPASSPGRTLAEFIAMAKTRPGKVFFGHAGIGTTTHLAGELLNQVAGISMVHVPYKGTPETLPPLMSGDTQAVFSGYSTAKALVEAGKLRVLAVASAKRIPILPDIPAIAETYPGFDVSAWTGFAAPAGVPSHIVERLAVEIRAIIQSPTIRTRFLEVGLVPGGETPAEFSKLIEDSYTTFGKVIQNAGIKPQ